MRLTKPLGFAGALIVAALVGGTLISTAFAQTDGETDSDAPMSGGSALGEYCDVFTESFAAELGVSVDDLLPAGKAAAIAAIDAAVAAGDLDEDRAATLKERIDAFEANGCSVIGPWHRGFGVGLGAGFVRGAGHGFMHADTLDAAAEALGLSSDELISRLADAGSLEAVAEEERVSYDDVKAAVIAAVEADLEAAVAEGLDQDRADAMLERVQEWLDTDGGRAGRGFGGPGEFRGHGRGHDFGFGPFGDED